MNAAPWIQEECQFVSLCIVLGGNDKPIIIQAWLDLDSMAATYNDDRPFWFEVFQTMGNKKLPLILNMYYTVLVKQ